MPVTLRRTAGLVPCALLALVLGACAGTQLAVHTAKEIGGVRAAPPQGEFKVGKPYRVNGVWYRPAINPDYDEVGIASWYGSEFQGRRTANGAVFDMNALSAAHRTLPMPSLVRVTNLDNGRAVVLTVNDRGPFARGRIIDVSRRAAQLLGFFRSGTARVRVQAVSQPRPQRLAASRPTVAPATPSVASVAADGEPVITPAPRGTVTQEPLPGRAYARTRPLVPNAPAAVLAPRAVYVQAGAFSSVGNAKRLSAALARFGETRMMRVRIGDLSIFRVQLGPFETRPRAEAMLARVVAAGHRDAHLVFE